MKLVYIAKCYDDIHFVTTNPLSMVKWIKNYKKDDYELMDSVNICIIKEDEILREEYYYSEEEIPSLIDYPCMETDRFLQIYDPEGDGVVKFYNSLNQEYYDVSSYDVKSFIELHGVDLHYVFYWMEGTEWEFVRELSGDGWKTTIKTNSEKDKPFKTCTTPITDWKGI